MAAQSRLTTALDQGHLTLPAGSVVILRPEADYDVSRLNRDAVTIVHSFYPTAAAWNSSGWAVSKETPTKSAAAIVVVPRSKALARALIAQACAIADLVVVDGQKTDGVDSLWKDCRKALGDLPSVTKDHGRLFWFAATPVFAGWADPGPTRTADGFMTAAGVFSDDGVDPGSALLAMTLPPKLPGRIADLGAGWGYLATAILARDGVKSLDLIEAEAISLDCARINISDPRVSFHWADATQFAAKPAYDGIVMNPPFHTSRAADPALGRAFVAAAARLLAPSGKLWMVANRHLPYEATLREHFHNVEELAGTGGFKVFHANRPQRP